jgi:hypothetical protein
MHIKETDLIKNNETDLFKILIYIKENVRLRFQIKHKKAKWQFSYIYKHADIEEVKNIIYIRNLTLYMYL